MASVHPAWDSYKERGTPAMIRLLVWCALFFGRTLTRLGLWPVVLYFYFANTAARRASQDYLRRVLDRRVTIFHVLRHFHTFATVSIDRVYLLARRERFVNIEARLPGDERRFFPDGRAYVLLVAHFGSFEALRVPAMRARDRRVSLVLDRTTGRVAMSLLEQLDPILAGGIIDASQRGPGLVLDIKQAVDAKHVVGMMGDRVRDDERAIEASFLGGRVRVPAGPWIVASALQVPVVLGFAMYIGGRYTRQLELLAERIEVPRGRREEALREWAQRYLDRLEVRVRQAPYNWFNFYDFWL